MCSIPQPPQIPAPPPPPDFTDEQIALARRVHEQNRKRIFAGLSGTIKTGAAGVTKPGRTTGGPSAK